MGAKGGRGAMLAVYLLDHASKSFRCETHGIAVGSMIRCYHGMEMCRPRLGGY